MYRQQSKVAARMAAQAAGVTCVLADSSRQVVDKPFVWIASHHQRGLLAPVTALVPEKGEALPPRDGREKMR